MEEFGEKCSVGIDLYQLKASSCTCPVKTACKHVAAALMELADRQGYPASQIMNAKMALKRVAAQSSSVSSLEQLPGMTVDGWHKFMEHYTYHLKPSYDQWNYVELLRGQFATLKRTAIPFSEADQFYFDFHQRLFILRKIIEQNAQAGVTFYTAATVYHLSDELDDWLKEAVGALDTEQNGERLTQTFAYLRAQMAIESPKKLHHFRVFSTFWAFKVASEESLIASEVAAFEAMEAAELSLSLCAGRAYLYLRQARTGDAWDALVSHASFKEAPALLFLPFLAYLEHTQDWREIVLWLRRLSSFYSGKRYHDIEAYTAYWKIAIAHVPDADALDVGVVRRTTTCLLSDHRVTLLREAPMEAVDRNANCAGL